MAKAVFGRPLDKLLEQDRRKRPQWNVPYIVHESVRCITRHGIDQEGIFRISGNKENVSKYQSIFDKGEEIDFVKEKTVPHDVASLLKQLLRELPDPVFTFALYDKWIQAYEMANREEQLQAIKALIESLPFANRALLSLLVPFFARIAANSSINKMDTGNLSKTIGPNLLWKDGKADSIEYLVNSSKVNDIMKILIDEHEFFFPDPLGEDENAKKWSRLDDKVFAHTKSIQSLANGNEDKQIWSCDSAGDIRIWDAQTCKNVKTLNSGQGRLFSMSRVGTNHIWTCSQASAKVWDAQSAECIKEISMFAYCAVQVLSPQGEPTVWVGSDSVIQVFDSKFEVIKKIDVARNVVTCMCLDPEGRYVWGSTTDRNVFIHVWDSHTGDLVKELAIGHTKKVNAFTVSKNKIWSAGDDGAVCVWDSSSFNLIKRLEGHQGPVYGVTGFGDFVWSCSWDTTIRIWNINSLDCVWVMNDYHSDCISGILAVFCSATQKWKAWTSSWDKSICTILVSEQHNIREPSHGRSIVPSISESSLNNLSSRQNIQRMNSAGASDGFGLISPSISSETDPEKVAQLLQKREEIRLRRKMLEERKQELDAKKKELERRRKEIASVSETLEKEIASVQM